MSDTNTNPHGIEPIDDNDLDAAAGGNRLFANEKEEEQAKQQAAADGRMYMLPAGNMLCVCSHKYKWCEYITPGDSPIFPDYAYNNVKCYHCGKTKKKLNR